MRFLHTADWHLGRIFYGQYLTEDQAHVLEHQFFNILKDENIDGILLAGDIFAVSYTHLTLPTTSRV